ncbi:Protein RALF-like 32 [Bienertia sinuspersici]
MECYQNYRPYTDQEHDSSATQVQHHDYDAEKFDDGKHSEAEHDTTFDDQKNYISFGALRGDQARPSQNHLEPANTWRRGHSKYYRCRG